MIARFLVAAAALACATQASAEHLYPRDECATIEGADAFRMGMVTAVANRNLELLRPHISDDILLDFGGGSGWEELATRLEERELWLALDEVLSLGCAANDTSESGEEGFSMPWVWNQDTGAEDPFNSLLAKGWKVPMRTEGRADAPLVRHLNWEMVELAQDWQGDEEYLRVRTRKGEEGYVAMRELRHELDYRMIVERREGRWQVTAFIAGD